MRGSSFFDADSARWTFAGRDVAELDSVTGYQDVTRTLRSETVYRDDVYKLETDSSPREFILFVTDGSISHRFRKAVRAVTISEHWEKIAGPREETKRPLMESEKCWT